MLIKQTTIAEPRVPCFKCRIFHYIKERPHSSNVTCFQLSGSVTGVDFLVNLCHQNNFNFTFVCN